MAKSLFFNANFMDFSFFCAPKIITSGDPPEFRGPKSFGRLRSLWKQRGCAQRAATFAGADSSKRPAETVMRCDPIGEPQMGTL